MEKTIQIFKRHFGYAYLKDLKKEGIHTDTVRRLTQEKIIEKIKPGLYKLVDMPMLANQGMIDVCMAMPKAIICLHSSISYYELTTTIPNRVMVALRRSEKPSNIEYPPVQVFYFSGINYRSGIEEIKTESGIFKIYNREKTIVDCFRYRNKLGIDIAREGLKNYLNKPGYNIHKLIQFAKAGRMYKILKPYIEAILEQ
jgi:predicted transcriptional regulator of viral defense system